MKKRVKGMTLLEIVISIAIFALLSLLLLQVTSTVNTIMRVTTDLSERLYQEKTYVNTNQTGNTDVARTYDMNAASTDLYVSYNGLDVAPLVPVRERVTKNDGSEEAQARDQRLDSNMHFRFLEFGGTKGSDVNEFASGYITFWATGDCEIKSIKVDGEIYYKGTTQTTNSDTWNAAAGELGANNGKFQNGDLILLITMPEETWKVDLTITLADDEDNPITVPCVFQGNRTVSSGNSGTFETVGEATAFFFNGDTRSSNAFGEHRMTDAQVQLLSQILNGGTP